MSQPAVVVVQPLDELLFALFGTFFLPPLVDDLMRLGMVKATVRASVERGKKQGAGLFRLDEGEHRLKCPDQFFGCFSIAQYRISREQQCIELTTHGVRIHAQVTVLFQCVGSQLAIGLSFPPPLRGRTSVLMPYATSITDGRCPIGYKRAYRCHSGR